MRCAGFLLRQELEKTIWLFAAADSENYCEPAGYLR